MATERPSKKRKTRSGCTGIELFSTFRVLQNFRNTIQTEDLVELDNGNLESKDNPEIDIEVDKGALAQLDGLIEWMASKVKSTKKVCP